MQDVVPAPKQPTPQSPVSTADVPVQTEVVKDLPVKAQGGASLAQSQAGGPNVGSTAPGAAPANRPAGKDDKELDKVLKSVSQKIKADDNKPPRPNIFKRWEPAIVVLVALAVAAALCVAAISAFKK
jgi:hypothetical protein